MSHSCSNVWALCLAPIWNGRSKKLEDITEEEEGLGEKGEGDEEEAARGHPGDQINQIIVQAASSVPHSTGRELSRPRKPEILWSLEEESRRLRREAKWEECKMIRNMYRPHKRRYHAELVKHAYCIRKRSARNHAEVLEVQDENGNLRISEDWKE
eukprot:9487125-Pyramimonas_sp.AAC.1